MHKGPDLRSKAACQLWAPHYTPHDRQCLAGHQKGDYDIEGITDVFPVLSTEVGRKRQCLTMIRLIVTHWTYYSRIHGNFTLNRDFLECTNLFWYLCAVSVSSGNPCYCHSKNSPVAVLCHTWGRTQQTSCLSAVSSGSFVQF